MKYKIGFDGNGEEEQRTEIMAEQPKAQIPVPSVVQVRFPGQGRSLAYYNDSFDLRVGDVVFVEGKLEGKQGIVTEVARSFRIKLSDYKRVIATADTKVSGKLYFGGSHLIAFDKNVIPYAKVRGWFLPPDSEEDVAVGYDDEFNSLEDLSGFRFRTEIAERGADYYNSNKVAYLSVDGNYGKAIVLGGTAYELTFEYCSGEVCNLTCSCFCSYPCKHEFALLLQLRETLEKIEELYDDSYMETDYFAAISKSVLLQYAVNGKEKGSLVLESETQ